MRDLKENDVADNTLTASPKTPPSQPFAWQTMGRLEHVTELTLHTMEAQMVFLGRYQKAPSGVINFGGRMTQVWFAARDDDPYADQCLLRTEAAIHQCQQAMAMMTAQYDTAFAAMNAHGNLSIQPLASTAPLVKTVWFKTPYGYLVTRLVADYDWLMRLAMTGQRAGIVMDQPYIEIKKQFGQRIAQIYKLAFRWHATGVRRVDVKEDNAIAKVAAEKNEALLPDVFSKALRARLAPNIQKTPPAKKPTAPTTETTAQATVPLTAADNVVTDKKVHKTTPRKPQTVDKDAVTAVTSTDTAAATTSS